MSNFTKAEGATIRLTFSESLKGDCTGEQSHFTVTVPEYNFVPGGEIQNGVKTVQETYLNAFFQQNVELSAGTLSDIVCTDGVLSLATDKTTGLALFTVTGVTGTVYISAIDWTESKPVGTKIRVYVSVDGTYYRKVSKGGYLLQPAPYVDKTVYIKVEFTSTTAGLTPTMSNLKVSCRTEEESKNLILNMVPTQRFNNAAGDITVAYSGGLLTGVGGPVQDFSVSFTPEDLFAKNHPQSDQGHLTVSAEMSGTLTQLTYHYAQANAEHLTVSASMTGVLTRVEDI